MASGSGDITPSDQGASRGSEDEPSPGKVAFEDGKGEGKKKKFKPLEKMMRFFKSGKKTPKSKDRDHRYTGSIKAKSTSALYRDIPQSEDEDDGGFKQVPLGGTRSISEDSVFHPEQAVVGGGIRKIAVSMDNIKQDFQPLPIAGKSSSQDSFNSIGGSEDDDDLFKTNWNDSVNVKKRSISQPEIGVDMDFSAIQRDTQTLDSEAAKFKISIKPKARKASKRATRPTAGTSPLPGLKEESPPREVLPEEANKVEIKPTTLATVAAADTLAVESEPKITVKDNKTSIQITGFDKSKADAEPTKTPDIKIEDTEVIKRRPHDDTEVTKRRPHDDGRISVMPTSPIILEEVKLRKSNRPKSMMASNELKTPGPNGSNELSKAFKRLSVRKERTEEVGETDKVSEPAKTFVDITPKTGVQQEPKKSSPVGSPSSPPATKPETGFTYVLKKEPLRKSVSESDPVKPVLRSVSEEAKKEAQENSKAPVEAKKSDTKVSSEGKSVVIDDKSTNTANKLSSPREEYRLKRAARSKTLPENPIPRELIDSKLSEPKPANPLARSLTSKPVNNTSSSDKGSDKITSPVSKRVEPKRLSLKDNDTSSSEPSWFALARQKQKGTNIDETNKDTPKKVSVSTPSYVPKTVNKEQSVPSNTKETVVPTRSLKEKTSIDSTVSKNVSDSSVKSSSAVSSKEEKEKINGNKKIPESSKSDTLTSRTKAFETKSGLDRTFSTSKSSTLDRTTITTKSSTLDRPSSKSTTLDRSPSTSVKGSSTLKSLSSSVSSSSTVPLWKQNLAAKKKDPNEVQIEIIDKSQSAQKPVPPRKPNITLEEKKTPVKLRDKPAVTETCGDAVVSKTNRKSTSVLDMVKNFQKLQVST